MQFTLPENVHNEAFFVLTGAKLVMGSHHCFIALLDFGALPNAVSFFSN